MREIVEVSPSTALLLPLTTALLQERGRSPRVAWEVQEIARDIQEEVETMRTKRGGEMKPRETNGNSPMAFQTTEPSG